jgi:hypothetical protein
VLIVTSRQGARALQDQRCQSAVVPLGRLARMPAPKAEKTKVVAQFHVPSIIYGTALVLPTHSMLMKIRSMVINAVFSAGQKSRERSLVLLFSMKTHAVDPWSTIVYQGI